MTKIRTGTTRAALAIGLLAVLALGAGQDPVGPMTRDEILKARPDWAAVMDAYRPRPDVLDRIRTFFKTLAVEVFFGLDSADSRDLVARFFRLYESLDAGMVTVKYVAVSPDLKNPLEDIQARIIESIPTLIVRVDDYELGRIIVAPQGSLEEGIESILMAYIDPATIDFNDRESLRGTKHNTLPIPCWPCHLAGRARPRSRPAATWPRSSSGTRPLPR
jgi:hypothetical protein